MIGYIGVTILLCCFGYIFYIFKNLIVKLNKTLIDVYKSGDSDKNTWYEHFKKQKEKIMARKDINLSIYIIVKLGMIYCIYYLRLDY
jgi:hypothetical protein